MEWRGGGEKIPVKGAAKAPIDGRLSVCNASPANCGLGARSNLREFWTDAREKVWEIAHCGV
jgi:hypothetical protein